MTVRRTGWLTHERYYWHDTGSAAGTRTPDGVIVQPDGHAESPESKRRFQGLVEAVGYDQYLTRLSARAATVDEVAWFHTSEYIDTVKAVSAKGGGTVGPNTPIGRGSYEIALLSAGGALTVADAVLRGQVDNAYALVRPPGHHAVADRGMGFCVFNNVVLAAHYARRVFGVGRIAIVDWDVHHGNGTQSAFYDDPETLTISVHQDGRYPVQSGALHETGVDQGEGYNINVPLPPGSGHGAYCAFADRVMAPAITAFRPEMILVSCGFDASGFDPMARMMAHSDTFRYLVGAVVDLAGEFCGGRLVLLHEGGYSTFHVPFCGLAVLEALTGQPSGVVDPYLSLAELPYQELLPHQAAITDAAAGLIDKVT